MRLTPELLLNAYAVGIFPMAESREQRELYWIDPDRRGVLPLEFFHLPKRLRRTLKAAPFQIRIDAAFAEVVDGCAEPGPGRPDTWINGEIQTLYQALFARGHAHSVESWRGGELVGGLYGVALGGAFFGESMFSRETDASKVALAYLIAGLQEGGFALLDTQFVTAHLKRFGAREIARADYRRQLEAAIRLPARFPTEIADAVLWKWMARAKDGSVQPDIGEV
jgi:leucyl/phenylalanyl-tRNA--protein transferase